MPKGLVFDDWGAEDRFPLPPGHRRLFPPFRRQQGRCFIVGIPAVFGGPSDTAEDPRGSRLEFYEDGRLLGPRHAIFEDIVGQGGGLYDHFENCLYFSTSDNSDPSRNGRVYTYRLGDATPKVLWAGGCHMNGAVRHLHNRNLIDVKGLGLGVAYSPLEAVSQVERQLGLRREISAYENSQEDLEYRLGQDLNVIDLLMIEITAHTNAQIGETCLNRCAILTHFINRLLPLNEEAYHLALRWFSHGLMRRDEQAREVSAEKLLQEVKGTALDTPDTRRLIAEARGVRETVEEMTARVQRLQQLTGASRLVIVYGPNIFFPDGRGMSWHANLEAETEAVAAALAAPFVNIGDLVREKGVAYAVIEDMVHHTEPFMGDIGDAALAAVRAHYGSFSPSAR